MPNESVIRYQKLTYPSIHDNSSCSTNGTVFYSLDSERQSILKRYNRSEDTEDNEDSSKLIRKLSKLSHQSNHQEGSVPDTLKIRVSPTHNEENTAIISNVMSISDKRQAPERSTFEMEKPDWSTYKTAWGFLQSLNPNYKSMYLERRDYSQGRPGYLFGRKPDSDIKFDHIVISKRHCLIYMENGEKGGAKGIRIYLEDLSFNGTFVNGEIVGFKNRVLLKHGDEIQLFKCNTADDLRYKFFRILLPSLYRVNTCEHEYKIGRLLGRGHFAGVYHAVHKKTNHVVAIKVFDKGKLSDKPSLTSSFIQEIGIMMAIKKHPFIVRINRIFNEAESIYLVLEYVPGGELFHYIRDKVQLDDDEARFIFWQLLVATKYIHDNDIAHRDLKPENILMVDRRTLHVKITDFGLANTEQRDQYFDSQCGTPNYVAPEVLVSSKYRAYDKQCDLWSLGVILFVCLGGYPPFLEKNKILRGDFNFDSSRWDSVQYSAKNLIKKHLTVSSKERITAQGALEHYWMRINPRQMSAMRHKLGEEVLTALKEMTLNEDIPLTQAI
ncbi:MAG: kinase-like domain-containing protein [Benjaminiella poitrasii]|nr:MAG: kinase-like domain-containing protein [Benjaminiella poitrasii]